MKKEILNKINLVKVFPEDEFGFVEAEFSAPADLIKEKFPEAKSATIWLRFLPAKPKRFSKCDVSPINESGDSCDKIDFSFDDEDLNVLVQKAIETLHMYGKPYLLITVADRAIMTERFKTFEEAHEQMLNELSDYGRIDKAYLSAKEHGGEEFGYSAEMAYVNDGINHDNYDWRIIKLFDE